MAREESVLSLREEISQIKASVEASREAYNADIAQVLCYPVYKDLIDVGLCMNAVTLPQRQSAVIVGNWSFHCDGVNECFSCAIKKIDAWSPASKLQFSTPGFECANWQCNARNIQRT